MPRRIRRNKKLELHHKLVIAVIGVVLLMIGLCTVSIIHWRQTDRLNELSIRAQALMRAQKVYGLHITGIDALNSQLNIARHDTNYYKLIIAHVELDELNNDLGRLTPQLKQAVADHEAARRREEQDRLARAKESAPAPAANPPAATSTANAVFLPILIYHKPPADFAAQMDSLAAKGYHTIHMSDVPAYLAKQPGLKTKPVVITFDDGYTVQSNIIPILRKHNFLVTLYLIVGGDLSHYCIGLTRSNYGCGDAYLRVADVKAMLSSGLVEIGAHTLDHPNLAGLTTDAQWKQIKTSRDWLQATFGMPVTSFAYPYGGYNSTSVQLVNKADFSTAVTTNRGIYQSPSQQLTLRRVYSVSNLP